MKYGFHSHHCLKHLLCKWLAVRSIFKILLLLPLVVQAQAGTRLDDSASPRQVVAPVGVYAPNGQPMAQYWADTEPEYIVLDFGAVDYYLDTSAYVGKQIAVYYVVPSVIDGMSSPNGLTVQWEGGGDFSSGSAQAGQRALVWKGVVKDKQLRARFRLKMQVRPEYFFSGRGLQSGFESYFEAEH